MAQLTNEKAIPNLSARPYGSIEELPMLEPLEYEMIRERTSRFSWEIKPHLHDSLYQIFFLTEGRVNASIDGNEFDLSAPTILFLPPLTVHGFQFEAESNGPVLTILDSTIANAIPFAPKILRQFEDFFILEKEKTEAYFEEFHSLFLALGREYRASINGRTQTLHSLLGLILVKLFRIIQADLTQRTGQKTEEHKIAQLFKQLVEDNYDKHKDIAFYAKALGVSKARLFNITNEVLNSSPKNYVYARMVLEIKRKLVYTNLSSVAIARMLGFKDPSYFSRFFRRQTGVSPVQFRRQPQIKFSNAGIDTITNPE